MLLLFLCKWDGAQKLELIMDRTNWKFGKTNHNLLVISAIFMGQAVPICFVNLGSAGNSNAGQRIDLLQKLLKIIPADKIESLMTDREFIGEDYIRFLQENNIAFITRIKENILLKLSSGHVVMAGEYFKNTKFGTATAPEIVALSSGIITNIQAKRTCKGLVLVIFDGIDANLPSVAEPVNLYRKRWRIECGFQALKKKGYDLEATHMKDCRKIELLMAIAAICFALSIFIAMFLPKPKIKNHGYPSNCLFTIGLKFISHSLLALQAPPPLKLLPFLALQLNLNFFIV